jgi:hypothetical protein
MQAANAKITLQLRWRRRDRALGKVTPHYWMQSSAYLGLDFGKVPFGARLAEGAYIVVQIPETNKTVWDWSDWMYNPISGNIVNRTDSKQLVPYNYLVFSISRYEES